MNELLQRSRIERAQELDVVCVDAILRHERNGLTVGVEELRRTFAHLLAVLHAHVHGLRGVQHFIAIELVGDISHLAQTVSCHVDVAKRLFEAEGGRNASAHHVVGKSHGFGVEAGHGLSNVGKAVAALVFLGNEVRGQVGRLLLHFYQSVERKLSTAINAFFRKRT